jgi:drug efflux transport system permease protein
MTAFLGLLRKELYHIRRDRRTLTVILLLPVVQVLLFGYAIRTDVDRVRLAIVDPTPDAHTLALRSRFAAAGLFRVVAVLPRASELDPLFRRGEIQEAVVFDGDFAAGLVGGDPAQVQLVVDAAEPNTASLVGAYARAVIQSYASEIGAAHRPLAIGVTSRVRFNPTRASSNLFVPGLMAFVLTIISSMVTAISLTREKETGTLEALLVSPLRPWSIVIGKVLPYLAIGFAAAAAILVEAQLVFHIPFRGSVWLLLLETLLFILTSLALGILISARTSSQRVATMIALVGTMLPNMLLSGFIFPLDSLPAPLRLLSSIVPGRWFVEIARGILLKGVGLAYLWQETLVLAVMTAVLLTAAMRSFKERLA